MKSKPKKRGFARAVWILAWVSFFTDVASEMLYPITPVYLQAVGVSVAGIAMIEGIAEAVAGITKSFFGYLGDRLGNPERYVQAGYGLSAIAKPVMGLVTTPAVFLGVRITERFGKGIRTTPRDAILTEYSEKEERGRVFGFHRGMDTLGAALGPIIALVLIQALNWGDNLRNIYFVAAIPGLAAMYLTFLVHSKGKRKKKAAFSQVFQKSVFKGYLQTFRPSLYSKEYKRLVLGFILVAILNSSDIFLLLRAREIVGGGSSLLGFSIATAVGVIGVYILYNFVFSAASSPMGKLSDRIGFKRTHLVSLCVFVITYTLLAQEASMLSLVIAMGLYGIFAAGNDTVIKAWMSTTLDRDIMGSGLGVASTLQSITFLVSSLVTGLLWEKFGSSVALSVSAIGMLIPIAYFHFLVPNNIRRAS